MIWLSNKIPPEHPDFENSVIISVNETRQEATARYIKLFANHKRGAPMPTAKHSAADLAAMGFVGLYTREGAK